MPKKSNNNRDNTLKSSAKFDKLSSQSGIMRWGDWVESRGHLELRDDGENRGSLEGRQTKGTEKVDDGVGGRQAGGSETKKAGLEE